MTFLANGGSGSMTAQEVSYNTAATLNTNSFERTGYIFAGWAATSDGEVIYDNGANITVTADTTLYAKWTANTYTVTFAANDGSGSMDAQTFTHGVAQALTANAFTRDGYTFNGWKDENGKTYADGANITVTGNITLTAQWVNSSFADELDQIDLGGGTVTIPDDWDGSSLDGLNPTRPGYTFDKWVNSEGNPTTTLPATAVWTPVENTVTIGSGDSPNGTIDLSVPSGTELKLDTDGDGVADQTVTVESGLTIEDPVKDGYIFTGWEQTENEDGSITLNATWSTDGADGAVADGIPDIYQKKVTFKVVNGIWHGTGNAEDIVVYVTLTDGEDKWSADGSGTVTVPTSTGITGYKADGVWDVVPAGTVTGTDAAVYTVTHEKNSVSVGNNGFSDDANDGVADTAPESGSIEIIVGNKIMVDPAGGIWTGFDGNGSFTTLQTYTIVEGNNYNLTDPTRTGCAFVGWKAEEVGTTILFTAQWMEDATEDGIPDCFQIKITYRVAEGEFWPNGGTEDRFEYVVLQDADGKWSTTGTGVALNAPAPVKDGFEHDGWYAITDTEQTNKFEITGFEVAEEIIFVPAWIESEEEDYVPVVIPGGMGGNTGNVDVTAGLYGNTAIISPIAPEQIEEIVEGNSGGDVVIDLTGIDRPIEGISIPKKTIETILETSEQSGTGEERLVIKLDTAELSIDRTAMEAIVEQAKVGNMIEIHFDDVGTARMNSAQRKTLKGYDVHKGYEAYITVNGRRISDFQGGNIDLLVPFALPAGYEIGGFSVWYIDEAGNPEKLKSTYDGEHKWFVATHFSDYVIIYSEEDAKANGYMSCRKDDDCPIADFNDASASAWYHDGVHYCLENGLMIGMPGDRFAPQNITTRAQVVTILWRLAGSPVVARTVEFEDVPSDAWFADAVYWAASEDIVLGYGNGSFGPNDSITREQMAAILWRYCEYAEIDRSVEAGTDMSGFADANAVSGWAVPAMQWVCDTELFVGIAQGRNMLLDPKGNAVRAQVATILWRFCTGMISE